MHRVTPGLYKLIDTSWTLHGHFMDTSWTLQQIYNNNNNNNNNNNSGKNADTPTDEVNERSYEKTPLTSNV